MSTACDRTLFQVSVSISRDARSSSIGLEQYGHWSGQRWVSSHRTA